MKNIDFIYLNNFSKLHNEYNIFFCKTDYLLNDFKIITNLNNKVILISGNSDYPITDEIINLAPKNIIKWYAQNALSHSSILCPIPIGLENKFISDRSGHGINYYDRACEKEKLLNSTISKNNKDKLIYANFNIYTNYNHRYHIKSACNSLDFIDWEEPTLTLEIFFKKVSEYKMILCPAGNGVDTHRLWEILYMNRIPITIKTGNYKIYKLYEQLPIIILNSIEELYDKDYILSKYETIINTTYDSKLLESQYWKNKILEDAL